MTVVLASRKNDTRVSARIIQWWTSSEYSHCELVVDGVSYSSSVMDGGVRGKVIRMAEDKWDFLELPWADSEKIKNYLRETDHHKYGWYGLATSQFLNLNRAEADAQFCSQWCAAALGLPNPASYSPATLDALCGFIDSKMQLLAI